MEVRLSPITGEPVIFATKRAQRPHFNRHPRPHARLDQKKGTHPVIKSDPFAVGNEHATDPELWADSDDPHRQPNTPGWKVRVIPNRYPITDHHEVIILSPEPHKDLGQVSKRQAERVVQAYLERTKQNQSFGHVFLFCNHGLAAGASIAHPHAQLLTLPALPPRLREEADIIQAHLHKKGTCLYCDTLEHEIKLKHRLVWQNNEFALICPENSGWPYQLLLMPKIHQAAFSQLKDFQLEPFAEALQTMLKLYSTVLDHPPYNYWIHSVKGHFFHWHLELIPRTKTLAGVELGAGLMVNDRITPENAATEFRQALKQLKI